MEFRQQKHNNNSKRTTKFLAHLIDIYQMCYCCRKLDFQTFSNQPQMYSCLIGSDRRSQTFEADFCTSETDFCTFEADLIYFFM